MNISRKKKQQIIAYLIIAVALYLFGYECDVKPVLGINLLIGVLIGSFMSRTKFSFSGNIRGPVLNRDYTASKLLLRMVIITTIGINWIVIFGSMGETFDYVKYLNQPTKVSLYFLVAAVIFGMGIALTGAAGSGFIRNSANLKFDYIAAMLSFFVGALFGVQIREFFLQFMTERSLYMPELFGWPLAIVIQCVLLFIVYKVIYQKEAK